MPVYSASQIVGKSLIATQSVIVKRQPYDNAPKVYTVLRGQTVGVVNSFLNPKEGRKNLYWSFMDSNKRPYYVAHKAGLFSLTALNEQGVLTVKEEQAAADNANKTFGDKILDVAKKGGGLLIAALVAIKVLPELMKDKK